MRNPLRSFVALTVLANAQYDWTSYQDGLPAFGTVLPNPNGEIPTNRFIGEPDWSKFQRTVLSLGYLLDHRFNDTWSIQHNVRYLFSDYARNQVQTQGLQADFRTIDRRARQNIQYTHNVTADTRLEAKFATGPLEHDALVAIDARWARFATERFQGNIASLDLFTPSYGTTVQVPNKNIDDLDKFGQVALYGQDQMRLGNVVLLGGLRQDWVSEKIIDKLTPSVSAQSDEALTYRAGLVYLFDNGLAPYASYADSYQPQFGVNAQGRPFLPETGQQYEVGLKFEPAGANARLTVAAFHLTRQNVLTPNPNDPANSLQTGEVTTRGIEVEGVASLATGLDVIATYTHNRARVTESNDADLGKRPVTVPDHMASLWTDYTIPSGDWRGFGFGAGVRFVGSTAGDFTNSFDTRPYALVDSGLHYDIGDFRLALNVSNLFDTTYVSTCFSTDFCYYGQRRTVLGTLRYTW